MDKKRKLWITAIIAFILALGLNFMDSTKDIAKILGGFSIGLVLSLRGMEK